MLGRVAAVAVTIWVGVAGCGGDDAAPECGIAECAEGFTFDADACTCQRDKPSDPSCTITACADGYVLDAGACECVAEIPVCDMVHAAGDTCTTGQSCQLPGSPCGSLFTCPNGTWVEEVVCPQNCGDQYCFPLTEVCVACNCGGPTQFTCQPIPPECSNDPDCGCLGEAVCGNVTTHDAVCYDDGPNAITCETGLD